MVLVGRGFLRQFYDLLEIFKIGGYCPDTNYLFLGMKKNLLVASILMIFILSARNRNKDVDNPPPFCL